MPRKPRPPMDLLIQGLSTGMVTRTIDRIDDFSGEVLPVPSYDVPRITDLVGLARMRKLKAEQAQAKQVQRTTTALNKALSTGMPSQFAQPAFKPFKRRI